MKLTARRIISDVERIAQSFEDTAALFMRSVSIGSELFDSVAIISRVVIWSRKEANGVVDKNALFPVSIEFCGRKDYVGEIVNEDVIGIVSFGAVDDNGLKIFVPALRFAEKVAQFAFAFDRIVSEAIDEIAGNVIENVGFVGMAAIIVDSRPKIVASEFSKIVHDVEPPEKEKPPSTRLEGTEQS